MRINWTHPGLIVESEDVGPLTIVKIHGRLRIEVDKAFAHRVHLEATKNKSVGIVVDMSKCDVLFGAKEAVKEVSSALDEGLTSPLPLAIVILPKDEKRFNEFADGISGHRAVRKIFITIAAASRWATEKGAVWRAMQADPHGRVRHKTSAQG